MELRKIIFDAAFGEDVKKCGLYETINGSWIVSVDDEKIADIHYYGLPGWQVFFKAKEFDMADADELLWRIGVPLSQRYPANGYEPRQAARIIK